MSMRTQAANQTPRIRSNDDELVPRTLLRAVSGLVVISFLIVVIATITGRAPTSTPPKSSVVTERLITISGQLDGSAVVLDAGGSVIARLGPEQGGFIAGLGRVLDRERTKHSVALAGPVLIRRMENGRVDIFDPSTGWGADLMGFGADNARAVAKLLN